MVTLRKIYHRDAMRIGICFGYDDRLKQSAKQIGALWSQTQKCWYVDYNTESYQKIKDTFPEIAIEKDTEPKAPPPAPGLQKSHDTAPIVAATHRNALPRPTGQEHNLPRADEPAGANARFLQITGKYWVVKIPYNAIIKQLKRFAGSRYSKARQCYLLPATPQTLQHSYEPALRTLRKRVLTGYKALMTVWPGMKNRIMTNQKTLKSDNFMQIFTSWQ